ncbi:hypothetical protein C8Q80DRAFT_1122257 [Daedaleopsis nitida]|nr:hypothetical protein C8Q80DRAFT_1122257 [Daedaleopsis nitida]
MSRAPSLQPGTVQEERARRHHASKAHTESRLRKELPEMDTAQCSETSISAGRDDVQSATRSPLTGLAEPVTVKCTVTPLDWPYPNGPIPYASSPSPSSSRATSDVTLARLTVDRTKCPPRSSTSKPSTSPNALLLVRASPTSDNPATVKAGDTGPVAPSKANAIAIASIKENTASLTRNIQQLKAISQSVRDREDFTNADARRNIAMQDLFKAHGADPVTARAMIDAAMDVFKSSPVARLDSVTKNRPSLLDQEHTSAKSRPAIPAKEPKVSIARRDHSSAKDPNHVAPASTSFPKRAPQPLFANSPSKPDSRTTRSGVLVKATAMSSPTRMKDSAPAADTQCKGPVGSPRESRRSLTSSTGASSEAAHNPIVRVEKSVQAHTSSRGSKSTNPPSLARRDAPLGTPSPKERARESPAEAGVASSSITRSTPQLSRTVMPAPKSTPSLRITSRSSTKDSQARVGVVGAERDPQTRIHWIKDIPRTSKPMEIARAQGQARTRSSATSGSSVSQKDVGSQLYHAFVKNASSTFWQIPKVTPSATANMASSTSSRVKKAIPTVRSQADKGPAPAVPKIVKSVSPAAKNPAGGSSTLHNSPVPRPSHKPSSRNEKAKFLDVVKLSQSAPKENPRSRPVAGKPITSLHPENPDDRSVLRTVSSAKPIPAVPAAPSERSSVVSYATLIVDRSAPNELTAPARTAPQTAHEVVSPLANFFAESVLGSSVSAAEFDDDDDYDSLFGRPKPLTGFLSLAPATIEALGVLQNASLSQVDVMKPKFVERTTVGPMRGTVIPPKRSARNGNTAAVGLKNSSTAVASSSDDSMSNPSLHGAVQSATALQNVPGSTLSGPSRGPSRASRARAGSLTSSFSAESHHRDLRRASRRVNALVDAVLPSYESLQRANSFMNAVYFVDEKVPTSVKLMRDLLAEEFPYDRFDKVEEEAMKRKEAELKAARGQKNSNVLARALQGLGGFIKKPSGVFLSTPPDVGSSGEARKK